MTAPAIRVQGLGKRFLIGARVKPADTMGETLANGAKRLRRFFSSGTGAAAGDSEEFWALRDVSFEVPAGQVLGIIGRNGSGKSTLLKILSRITPPTEGDATIVGRVGSLLEIGTGFHGELTGRENVFLNGTILGMRHGEIAARFDEIVAFSGVEQFIDTPVKHYSSGMYLRLAFAVAAHLRTEILLIDEVLAVGDAVFQKKCIDKMGELAREGRTVLFVSHNLGAIVRLCDTGLLLDSGRIAAQGATGDVVSAYGRLHKAINGTEQLSHRDGVGISGFGIINEGGVLTPSVPIGLALNLVVRKKYFALHVHLGITAPEGSFLVIEVTDSGRFPGLLETGCHRVEMRLPPIWLRPGSYTGWVKIIAHPQQGATERFTDLVEMPVTCDGPVDVSMVRLLAPEAKWSVQALGQLTTDPEGSLVSSDTEH